MYSQGTQNVVAKQQQVRRGNEVSSIMIVCEYY
jgi:hypothetical protein